MSEDDFEYYERRAKKTEQLVAVVMLAWMFMSGAVAGWISRGIWG